MRIVIVDSDEISRTMIKKAVNTVAETHKIKSGCVIVGEAADGRKGCELIIEERPDLIIMDLELPGKNGLSLLKKVRSAQIHSRVLVITKDNDFDRTRQAISLGVDEYLLKPAKKVQIMKALQMIEDKLAGELVIETALSVENIFMACLNGQIHSDEIVDEITYEKYGFTLSDSGNLFVVWLGNGYMEQKEMTYKILEKLGQNQEFSVCVLPIDEWHLFTVVIYGREKKTARCAFFENVVIPRLSGMIRGELVCLWDEAERLEMLNVSLKNLRTIREWNLFFDRGDLIRCKDVEAMEIVPLKYPSELEHRLRRASVTVDRKEIIKCYDALYDLCKRDPHSPSQIKEVFIRFNMAVLNSYKLKKEIHSELQIQRSMQDIAKAMSWGEIRAAVELFFQTLNFQAEESDEYAQWSPLIQKAVQMVKKEYDQGITLEELADKLFVSEEYLSSQFKKETGSGFKEMVRSLQIERIKDLLANTKLKLNQIAELAGYSDAKYMSRVFKEEVGVLPSDFRKSAH
ncbi:response regulator transcription factor [Mediterraneibacter sp.]|jgi:two-component system response regulator YesN|uniref:response regulator transcription factor n=1 Tax=Mediterraneibacter sp. TaxID=2316022 RepID=UPI0027B9801B|nr:helix-turn-helix domain-containing protein [Mediterraneibacter sp.]